MNSISALLTLSCRFVVLPGTAIMSRAWWATACHSSSPPARWRTPTCSCKSAYPTAWACSCRRPTSYATTWEDLQAGRTWWPEEIWGQYADSLSFFAAHPTDPLSLSALNHMVNDALSHVPDCLDYLSRLRNHSIFEFCAIPQTMAIATLTEVYNNPAVFERNVKVRKGAAAKMMLESGTLIQVQNWFRVFVEELERKMPRHESVRKGEGAVVGEKGWGGDEGWWCGGEWEWGWGEEACGGSGYERERGEASIGQHQ